MGISPEPYTGPVPIVTHVHGAHVDPASDGYPEAWYLPAANNIPTYYTRHGRLFDDATGNNPGNLGYANFSYRNDQAATTLWYHDHALGMTRSNVYAGPAGFWLIWGGAFDGGVNMLKKSRAILPGPAPRRGKGCARAQHAGQPCQKCLREIPIAIQDRSFNTDDSLFYPQNRAFFEGLDNFPFRIPLAPQSDVAPIWNPEAFFNVMVVNGVTWPKLEVAQARYRFRLLNGCNSRVLNLALFVINPDGSKGKEIPFYQIGAEQGFLPKVVRVKTGEQVALTAGAPEPASTPNPTDPTALLMGGAERADVIVDFSGLPNGTVVRMVNVTETPRLDDTEEWKIYNFTVDAYPIHLHLVRFEVVSRTNFDGTLSIHGSPQPREDGYKDMVIAYPGEITTVKAKFDIPGLYVWHCHIVEQEANEMMRPYVVSAVPPPPYHHDFDDRDRDHHKMKHQYRWADKRK